MNPKLLALDTSTETLSVAVTDGRQVWRHDGPGGAQASATLIPVILSLLDQAGLRLAALDAIAFGSGPGSFTGLRTACSVAQGLGFGAGLPLLPVDSLLAVAEEARRLARAERVVAALDARMDEVYVADYAYVQGAWHEAAGYRLVRPEGLAVPPGWTLAGNAAAAYGARVPPHGVAVPALPTAEAMLRLAPALLAAGQAVPAAEALPRYIRDKVAKTTEERAAEKAAASAVSAPPVPPVA